MTIRLHHLGVSRSSRIIWLLEELALDYELVVHTRDAKTHRAPPELAAIHPLGKAPTLEIDGRVMVESGAIIEYVVERHGGGKLLPADEHRAAYLEWLHFAEGTLGMPMILSALAPAFGGLGDRLGPFVEAEVTKQLDYVDAALAEEEYLVGGMFTGADINLSYLLHHAENGGHLESRKSLKAYQDRLKERVAYKRAIALGGPITIKRG